MAEAFHHLLAFMTQFHLFDRPAQYLFCRIGGKAQFAAELKQVVDFRFLDLSISSHIHCQIIEEVPCIITVRVQVPEFKLGMFKDRFFQFISFFLGFGHADGVFKVAHFGMVNRSVDKKHVDHRPG